MLAVGAKQLNLLKETGTFGENKNATHIVGISSVKSFTLNEKSVASFWQGYCELVNDSKIELSIREKPRDDMPVTVRLRLKFNASDDPYDENFLNLLCYCYQQAMRELLDINDGKAYICAILESDKWHDNDGHDCYDIELRFPYCRVNAQYQDKILRERAIEIIRRRNVIGTFPSSQPIGDWPQIIRGDSASKAIPLVGSVEEKGQLPLKLSKFFRELPDPDEDEDLESREAAMEDLFDPECHIHVAKGFIKNNVFIENDEVSFWLPFFLSIGYNQQVTLPKAQNETKSNDMHDRPMETNMDIALAMMDILNTVEVTDNEWHDIGQALCQADDGGSHGLDVWKIFTKKKKPSLANKCHVLYDQFRQQMPTITYRTLGFLARQKARHLYDEWHHAWCEPTFKKALDLSHNSVAKALYRVYWLDFVCARDRKGWYQYRDHRWRHLGYAHELGQEMSTTFVSFFEHMRMKMSQKIYESSDPRFKKDGEDSIKAINTLILKLKNQSYKGSLMKEAVEIFSLNYENFEDLLDSNVNIMGVRNGVIEIYGDRAIFRSGKPEDFIMKNMGIYYIDYSKDDKDEKITESSPLYRLKDWLGKVFPDKEVYHFFMKLSASFLRGGNTNKIFPIFTGNGNNSKSMIVKLFEATFGNYCIKFPITLLTGKRTASSNATPELARAYAVHIAFVDEPGGGETMGNGQIKGATGGDSVYVRGMYKEGKEIKSTFTLCMQCNDPPSIPHADEATRNRVKLVPFVSKWSTCAPKDPEEQMKERIFKLIKNFDQFIPALAPAFLWMLMKYYPIFIKEDLIHPKEVVEATREYWRETDVYQQFTDDMIQYVLKEDGKTPDINAKLSLSDVYNEFKLWYRENFPSIRPPDRAIAKKELIARWGKMSGNSWLGIAFKDAQAANLGLLAKC